MIQILQSCLVQSRDVTLIILMGNDPTRHRNVDPTVNAKLLDSNDFMLHYQAVNEDEYCKYILSNDGSHNYGSEFQYRWVHKSEEQVQLLYAGVVQSSFGCSQSRYEAVFEYLPYRLAHLEELTIENGLSILWKTLIGYRKLHGAYGWFDISERMIGFNRKHEIRVWLNQNIHFNQPDQNKKSVSLKSQTQSEMISRLFSLINQRKGKSEVWDAFNAAKNQVTFFRFQQAIDMLEEFANLENIRLKHFIVNPFNKPHLNQQIIDSRDSDRSRSESVKLLKLIQSAIPEDLSQKTFEIELVNGSSNAARNSGFIQSEKKQFSQSAVHPLIGMHKIEVKPRVALQPEMHPAGQVNPLRITCNLGASFSPTTQTIQPLKLQPDKNLFKQGISIDKIIEFDVKKQQRVKSRENQSQLVRPPINPQNTVDPHRIRIIPPKAEPSRLEEADSVLDNCSTTNQNSTPIQIPTPSLSASKVPLAFPYALLPQQFPYLPKGQKEGVQFRESSLSSLLEATQRQKQQFSKLRERLQFQSLPKQQQLFPNPILKPQQKSQPSLAEKDETPIRYFLPQRSQSIDSQLTSSFCGSSSLRNSLISMEVEEELISELTHSISSVDGMAKTEGNEIDSRQITQDKKNKKNNYLPMEANPIAEVENDDESQSFYQTGGDSFQYSSLLKESIEKAENSQEGIRTSQLQQPQQTPLPTLGRDLELQQSQEQQQCKQIDLELQQSQEQQQCKQIDELQRKEPEQCDESSQTVFKDQILQEIQIVPILQKVSSKQPKINPLRSQLLSYRDLSNLLASGMAS